MLWKEFRIGIGDLGLDITDNTDDLDSIKEFMPERRGQTSGPTIEFAERTPRRRHDKRRVIRAVAGMPGWKRTDVHRRHAVSITP